MTESTTQRRHDLDALRAFAMLLGIGLHAAMSFAPFPWTVQDVRQHELFTLFFLAVHGFRMQLFFLVSGFFTVMLWRRYQTGRWRRRVSSKSTSTSRRQPVSSRPSGSETLRASSD